jgi:hypothetical protein
MSSTSFIMYKSFILLLILSFASCTKKELKPKVKSENDFIQTSDLYSKVFYISPKLNSEDCSAYNDGCDCCDGKIVFLNNETFITDFYCIPTESFNTGTYKIENQKLVLNYSKKEALFGPVNEEDFEAESILRLETSECGKTSLDIIKCGNQFVFKGKVDYFTEDEKVSFKTAVNEYKKSGVWKLLDVKE